MTEEWNDTAHDCPDCGAMLQEQTDDHGYVTLRCIDCEEEFFGVRENWDIVVQGRMS